MIKKLQIIQSELKAPKSNRNTFGNYNYRSCEDILEAVKPLLAKQELVLLLSDEVVCVGTSNYIKATARLTDEQDKYIEVTAYAREAVDKKGMDDAQITGAASSYARKYALNGMFAIDDTKDADTQDNRPATTRPAPKRTASIADPSLRDEAAKLMVEAGIKGTEAIAFIDLTIGKKTPVTTEDFKALIAALENKPSEGK